LRKLAKVLKVKVADLVADDREMNAWGHCIDGPS
jgi:hypothetical protein